MLKQLCAPVTDKYVGLLFVSGTNMGQIIIYFREDVNTHNIPTCVIFYLRVK